MPRLRSWNAYESTLAAGIDDTVQSISVGSAAGLAEPVWLVIDPLEAATREYVLVTSISGTTLTVVRGGEGSTGGVAHPHAGGAIIRAVPVHQWLDTIFDDIELNASGISAVDGTLSAHLVDAGDPHAAAGYLKAAAAAATYLPLSGGALTGPLAMGNNKITGLATPTDPADAATLQYVQDAVGGIAPVVSHDQLTNVTPDQHHQRLHTHTDPLDGFVSWTAVTNKPTQFTPTAHTHDAGEITTGTLNISRIPNLPGSIITSGTVAYARLPVGTGTTQVAQGSHTHTYLPINNATATGYFQAPAGSFVNDPDGSGGVVGLRIGNINVGFTNISSTAFEVLIGGSTEQRFGAHDADSWRVRNIQIVGSAPSSGYDGFIYMVT